MGVPTGRGFTALLVLRTAGRKQGKSQKIVPIQNAERAPGDDLPSLWKARTRGKTLVPRYNCFLSLLPLIRRPTPPTTTGEGLPHPVAHHLQEVNLAPKPRRNVLPPCCLACPCHV